MEVTLLRPPAANHGPLSRPRHWPLFALSTAAALRERGHGVRLIDAHLDRPDPQATAARVADSRPDAVLVFSADYNRRIPDAVLAAHLDAIAAAAPDAGRLLVARNSLAEARRKRAAQPAVKAVTVGEPEAAACRFVGAPAAAGPGLLFHLGETVAPAGPEATPAVPAWDLSPPGGYGLSPHQSRG